MGLVEEYESKVKKAPKTASSSKTKPKAGGSKLYSVMKASDLNLTEKDLNEHRKAVEELIRVQKQEGTVEEWLEGYMKELEEVRRRRLRPLSEEEVREKGVKYRAVKLRMNLEPKRDGRKKARQILQGFREPKSWDGGAVDSPVASLSTIRTLLFMTGNKTDIISSIDVVTAFLQSVEYGPEEEPRYVSYKPYKGAETEYYQLLGPIYGQRSASLRFYKTLSGWLESQGFKAGLNEPCVFTNPNGLTVCLWVDDILVRGSEADTAHFYKEMGKRFNVKDPSYLTPKSKLSFVGLDMSMEETDRGQYTYSIDQDIAMNSFLEELEINYNSGVQCPMPDHKLIYEDNTPIDNARRGQYQSIVGTLNYFSHGTRYDIAHSTARLSQFSSCPTEGAWKSLHRILQYLSGNRQFALRSQGITGDRIEVHSDSDHAGDKPYTTKSHTGCMILMNRVPIHWMSKKQVDSTAYAYSSALAEIYALSETVRAAQLYGWRCEEMNINVTWPMNVKVDNKQSETFQKGTCLQSRLRGCIDLRDAWVKELRDKTKISVSHVDTESNMADILTKCMPNYKFQKQLKLIGGSQMGKHMAAFMRRIEII